MNQPPKFNVVIPLYSKRRYIRRAAENVLNQTLMEFELIIIDDASSDKCAEVISNIKDELPTIALQSNQGEDLARPGSTVRVEKLPYSTGAPTVAFN